MDYPLRSLKSDCRTCYKCIRHCPVKAISFHDGQAHIEQSECLYCGSCYETCPSHAKVILKASFCLGDCQKGGVEIQVGNKRIHGVKPEDCEKILNEEILPQLD